ncbi:hypothetical protein GE061_014054 [Apolygus lucorum]|uniref:Uncharacterized protein n=1 Tax=Apolygus lucorum TaxID=248454 RepID=A0A8S9XRL9_APOLU|nr:hypothetical protein GE061_014054 [Apolygus lucorum]
MEKRGSTVSVAFKRDASVVFDSGIPDVTRGKVFPSLILLLEALYMFSVASISVYGVHGFGEFMVLYDELKVLTMTIEARFYGCCFVLLAGVLCDSYVGHYYSVLVLLFINMCMPILHFIIAVYPREQTSNIKLAIAEATFPFWGILLCATPLRIRVISTAVFELSYFRKTRTFFSLLVYVWYLGAFTGGLVVYLSGPTRIGFTIILGVNVIFQGAYVGFWMFSRKTLSSERVQLAVVERAISYTLCKILRKIDRVFLHKYFFKKKQDPNDFRCVRFSDRTVTNCRSILGTLLIILPLTAYFSMLVLLEMLYHSQISMLEFSSELFPLITMKDGIFLVLYPPLEFFCLKFLDKWYRNSITKQLTLIGIGAFVISFSVMWTAVVQHEISKDSEFWEDPGTFAYVSFTNYLETPVSIRGRYYNQIVSRSLDEWTTLDPMKPLFVLKIPETHIPFHMEFENSNLSLYDEYNLPLLTGASSWYFLLPHGLTKVHPSCHGANQQVALNPSMFEPATVCVMCALAVCNGRLLLQGEQSKDHKEIPLGEEMGSSKVHLSGTYQVVVRFGELDVSGEPIEVNFEKLGSYLLIIYETRIKLSSNSSKQSAVVTFERSSAVDVMKLFSPKRKSYWWMLPTIVLHALGQVFAEVSLLTCLYMVAPHDVRGTVFSLATFLSLPAHVYLYQRGILALQQWKALYFFTLGCTNCLFMIIYFFSSVYYVHLFINKRTAAPRAQRRSLNAVTSDLTVRTNEEDNKES